ncbi:kelch-like protein 26 [Mercenaria mercenaria]|uniref:kelch-like protein 26 n=1 Tax=Mercenaria mercenaria TaxID=6596 RepID=UPI00234F91CD|nr:kelch-like protein 26 [Mercenaria mercenaria]
MVLYRASESHFTSIMSVLNQLRREKTFCDVILKVQSSEIHAHRSVLAAGCPYFKSLFLGHFSEATMKEINLSEVTENVDALEIILNFIYSGEVEINMDNLGIIVKLSSFFLLETLRQFSADFMKEALCLKTCLKFYLYAAEHGITDVEVDSELMMKSRFHDFLIFEESTLNLSADELACLIEKDVFEHCSAYNIVQFVTKWVNKGKTAKHVSVGLELLDTLNRFEERVTCTNLNEVCLETLYERLVMTLETCDIENKEDFLSKLKTAVDEVVMDNSSETDHSQCDVATCSTSLSGKGKKKVPVTELAVVTLSPKLCVIQDYKKARLGGLIHHVQEPFNDAVFDVCTYIPRTRSWYYVCELHEQGGMPEYLIDGSGYESRLVVLDDNIAFVDNRGDYIDLYNLKSHTWHAPDVQYYDTNINPELEDGHFQANDVCFVTGKGDEKYMIVRMRLFTDNSFDQATDMYFRGYILRSDGESWDCIFVTPTRIRTNLSDNGGMPEMNAHISKTSNEMLVTHSTLDGGWNIVFVANLNNLFPVPVILKSEFIEDQDIFRGSAILEEEDRLLIVSNGTKNCGHEAKILYEYKFNSEVLTEVNLPRKEIATIKKPYVYDDEETEYPCLCEFSATDGHSLWYIEGNLDIVSAFTEVQLDSKQNLITKKHTPPPFACITRAFAGQVRTDILSSLKPISHFLVKENSKN